MENGSAKAQGQVGRSVAGAIATRWLIIGGALLVVAAISLYFLTRPLRQRSQARHDVEILALAFEVYGREQGEYPHGTTAEMCRVLLGERVGQQNVKRLDYVAAKAYEINAAGEFVDPWGSAYRFVITPVLRIYSCGPNRIDEQGRGDDIAAEK